MITTMVSAVEGSVELSAEPAFHLYLCAQPVTKNKRMPHQSHLLANHSPHFSRRRFIASASILTTVTCLGPRQLFAEKENIVLIARKKAETATVTAQTLRGNVSALIGSGGNIAVLTGSDGKVIVDSGYATSRPKITEALTKISSDPIRHL